MSSSPTKQQRKQKPKRDIVLRVRVLAKEHELLLEMANEAGMEKSRLVRTMLFSGVLPKINKEDPEKIRHLAKIGNNINQIARACNEQRKTGNEIPIFQVLHELRTIERALSCL